MSDEPDPEIQERPVFQHPQWMVGIVLILAVAAIVAGLDNPIWFVIGAPCILVLVIWLWVKLVASD
jgi:hypothetical protein